ncbi:CHAD domain-containing protein [Streptomyces sp. NPDC087460]|uniref:CHAD domain-containing protein n=1 Tax=Streptomyces sp. NPDC087460 TaxID=3365791 RepID=UPI0038252141
MGGGARAGAGTGGAGAHAGAATTPGSAHAGAGTGSAHAGARTGDAGTDTGTATTSGNPHAGAGTGSAHAGARTGDAGTHTGTDTTPGNPHTGAGTGADATALADYLRAQATEFLRALRRHRESGAGAGASGPGAGGPGRTAPPADDVDAVRALRRAARRISGTLHTFQPLLDASWAEEMRPELAWLSGTLALEHAYASRLERLLQALHRLSGSSAFPAPRPVGRTTAATNATSTATTATVPTGVPAPARPASPDRGSLTVGAAKAGALLDRQLTLARTRAHSTALQALGSSRFHAVADKVALLASEVPLRVTARPNRGATAPETTPCDLRPLAAAAEERLADAVTALPLVAAGSPYNAQALVHGLSPDPASHPQDAPWHQVRLLLRLHRYALEALAGADAADAGDPGGVVDVRLLAAGEALDRHRDASEAAAAAAQAARTPRIAPATAYALGVLHADQRHEVEAARYAFQHSWRKEPIRLP